MRRSVLHTLVDARHPIWESIGMAVRLTVLLVFIVTLTYATSNQYDVVWNDEGGHDLLTFLALGGWSEYQRRRRP